MMDNRVCFYSPNDLSIGYNLELAEKAIIKYKSEPASTLTDVIELFHIKKLIDNDCRLKCWSDIMFNQIKEDIKNYNDIIAKHFAKLIETLWRTAMMHYLVITDKHFGILLTNSNYLML